MTEEQITPPRRPVGQDEASTPGATAGDPVARSTDSTSSGASHDTAVSTPREEAPARRSGDDPLRGSRSSAFYVGTAALAIVLVLLIIFIAQNTRKTTVSFLMWDGQVSVAVALLIATAAGLFLALMASSMRIFQLRRRVRRERKAR